METEDVTRHAKKKPTKIEEMSKEQIRQAILKKRECNAKAQRIVENLLEKCVTEEYLVSCLPDINQSHFVDVIEERSIVHLCGYPLCPNTISEKDIPKQKYRISLKTNKVYDITARKSFCSNGCYMSATHVKKQMLTSPLWFREYEEIPTIQLLPMNSVGSLGQEIDLNIIEKINVKKERQVYTSIKDFASASLNEMSGEETKLVLEGSVVKTSEDHKNSSVSQNNDNHNHNSIESKQRQDADGQTTNTTHNKKEINKNTKLTPNPLNIVGDIVEKPERKLDPIITASNNEGAAKSSRPTTKVLKKKQPSLIAITIEVEKCLAEWITLDTLIFLVGEEKVKEMVVDKGDCITEYLNNYAKSIFYCSNTYDQYQALCKKLNMLELEDRKYDVQTLQRETKPLPDYSILQEESKKIQLKVKAFYAGETNIPEPEPTENPKPTTEENENPTQLPLVDKNAQNALRRRIVCQHLNKMLPDLLRSLGLAPSMISTDIRLLVNTFKLKANNIMFKPIQWTLIAMVFVKLLSIRDKRLEYLLAQPKAFQHMQLLLLSYKQDGGYLERLISWLTDIDRMLDVNDTQLTIE